ncbi:hypothetical protein GCM10027570_06640 [Streptomonospora sediminis]
MPPIGLGSILSLSGIVISIAIAVISYYLGRHQRRRPRIHYATDFDVIMSPGDQLSAADFLQTRSGAPVTQLSRTYIAVWNHNGDTIKESDISPSDPLRVEVPEGDYILKAEVAALSRTATLVRTQAESGGRSAQIHFDFLDSGDGAVLEVVHQGSSGAHLSGTVRGARISYKGRSRLSPHYIRLFTKKSRATRFIQTLSSVEKIAFAALATIGGFSAITLVNLFNFLMETPVLVDPDLYNLETLEGQADFAANVHGFERTDFWTSAVFVVPLYVSLTIIPILYFFSKTKSIVPKHIVNSRNLV